METTGAMHGTLSHEDYHDLAAALAHAEAAERASALAACLQAPTGDPRLRPLIERLLDDRTPVIVSAPFRYGELRWLAAHALAGERAAAGVRDPVEIPDALPPLGTAELLRAAEAAGVPVAAGAEGLLSAFGALRERGLLSRRPLRLVPGG